MGLIHKHDYQPERTERESNGAIVRTTKVVKCSRCPKEGVSDVTAELDPRFRNRVIDNQ